MTTNDMPKNEYGQWLCPVPSYEYVELDDESGRSFYVSEASSCKEPLYLETDGSTSIDDETRGFPEPEVRQWQVKCLTGHVIMLSLQDQDGSGDAEDFDPVNLERVIDLMRQRA